MAAFPHSLPPVTDAPDPTWSADVSPPLYRTSYILEIPDQAQDSQSESALCVHLTVAFGRRFEEMFLDLLRLFDKNKPPKFDAIAHDCRVHSDYRLGISEIDGIEIRPSCYIDSDFFFRTIVVRMQIEYCLFIMGGESATMGWRKYEVSFRAGKASREPELTPAPTANGYLICPDDVVHRDYMEGGNQAVSVAQKVGETQTRSIATTSRNRSKKQKPETPEGSGAPSTDKASKPKQPKVIPPWVRDGYVSKLGRVQPQTHDTLFDAPTQVPNGTYCRALSAPLFTTIPCRVSN